MASLRFTAAVHAVAIGLGAFSAGATAQTYTYDVHGRLLRVVYANGAEVGYTYDKAGNRLTETVKAGTGPAKPTAAGSPVAPAATPRPANAPSSTPARVDGRADRTVIR